MIKYTVLIIFLICFFTSCKLTEPKQEGTIVFEIERTPCFGYCPEYKMKIYKNGFVYLNAKRHLDMEGEYKSNISENKLNELIEEFNKNNFFSFEDKYTAKVTDLPTTTTTFRYEGEEKRIVDYHGAPKKLKNLEMELHALIEELDWEPLY